MTGGNPMRGDVLASLDGRRVRLRLTLGALAEIEARLGVSGMDGIGSALPGLSREELAEVLLALMQGGESSRGHTVDVARLSHTAMAGLVARTVREALR
jgi:hypothetical protein